MAKILTEALMGNKQFSRENGADVTGIQYLNASGRLFCLSLVAHRAITRVVSVFESEQTLSNQVEEAPKKHVIVTRSI